MSRPRYPWETPTDPRAATADAFDVNEGNDGADNVPTHDAFGDDGCTLDEMQDPESDCYDPEA